MKTNEQKPSPSPELDKLQDALETEAKSLFFAEGEFVVNSDNLTLGILAIFFPKTSLMISIRISDGFKEYTVAKSDPALVFLTGSKGLISFPTYEQVRAFRRTPQEKIVKEITEEVNAKFLANVSVLKNLEILQAAGAIEAPKDIILFDLSKSGDEGIIFPNLQAGQDYLALFLADKNQMGRG